MSNGKAKTRKIVAKRFKFTKTGKIIRRTSATSHLKRRDTNNTLIRKRRNQLVLGRFAKKIRQMVRRQHV